MVHPSICNCNQGFSGTNCQLLSCYGYNSTNSNVCSSNEYCYSINNCTYNSGWTGFTCNIPVCYGINGTNALVCS